MERRAVRKGGLFAFYPQILWTIVGRPLLAASRHSCRLVFVKPLMSNFPICASLLLIGPGFSQPPQRIQAAAIVMRVDPVYPPRAKLKGIRGVVRFDATITKDGRVASLKLIRGNAALTRAAREAVTQWVFKPTLLNGEPIEVIVPTEIPFGVTLTPKRIKAG